MQKIITGLEKRGTLKKSALIYILLGLLVAVSIIPKEVFKRPSLIGGVVAQTRIVGGAVPPYFDFNLSNYTVNQSGIFVLDVNCSDIEFGEVISYYDNFTGFEINRSTGLVNQTRFLQGQVGNQTINITCSDGNLNASQAFVLTIIDDNQPPVLDSAGDQLAIEGSLFTMQLSASDPDNDDLIFGSNSTILSVNAATGLVNFTPAISQIGNHTINLTVFDGLSYDHEIILLTIVRGPFCGDGSCGSGEACSNCEADCGSCPPGQAGSEPGAQPGTGSTQGGGGGAETILGGRAPFYRCDEKWECTSWTTCSIENIRTRTCKDINKCVTKQKKPVEIEACEYTPTCDDNIRNGEEEGIDCGGPCKPCFLPNCFDRIQNQNETGIDCGGPCKACEERKFTKPPVVELPSIIKILPKQFPWLLLILIAIIIIVTITSDRLYVRKLRKKKFDEYREEFLKYRPLRRKIYKTVFNISLIAPVVFFYIYYFSNNMENLIRFSWIPLIVILSVPIGVSIALRKLAYYEYKRVMKERRLQETHKREVLQLVDVENQMLEEIESKAKKKIYDLAVHHRFDSYPDIYMEVNPIYETLAKLTKRRRERMGMTRMSAEAYKKILRLLESSLLKFVSKDYPEFMSALNGLRKIEENLNLDTYDIEDEFMDDIVEISKPHIISVVTASSSLASLYNELVDLYEYFRAKHADLEENDRGIKQAERLLSDEIKGLSKKAQIVDEVQKESDLAGLYNSLIDLLNHYLKKQELSSRIKGS